MSLNANSRNERGIYQRSAEANRQHNSRRLARSAVIVLGGCALFGAGAMLYVAERPQRASATPIPTTCNPPVPEPGPARRWEGETAVSTYSRVNMRNGNVFTAIPIVSWSGIGPGMNMMLYHNSANAASGYSIADVVGFDLGSGWSFSYSDHLRFDVYPNPTQVTVVSGDGTQDVYGWSSSQQEWIAPAGVYDTLTQDSQDPSLWRVKHKDQSYHQFSFFRCHDRIARLERIVDATGNATAISYTACNLLNPAIRPRLQGITGGNRPLNLVFVTDSSDPDCGRLREFFDPSDGDANWHDRRWTLEYYAAGAYDAGWLKHVEDAMQHDRPYYGGYLNTFTYDRNGRLELVSDKCDGCSPWLPDDKYRYTYDAAGWVQTIVDPVQADDPNSGLTQYFAAGCGPPPGVTGSPFSWRTYTDRRGSVWGYTHYEGGMPNAGTLSGISGPVVRHYSFDDNRNLQLFYDGELEVSWGAEINFWWATYDTRGNLLTLTDPLYHHKVWTYDAFNNPTSYTDAVGNVTRYYYDESHSRYLGACDLSGSDCLRCSGGSNNGIACEWDGDCPQGTCAPNDAPCRACDGGLNFADPCTSSGDCPGANCYQGTCLVTELSPRAPTLLTRIVEPNDSANPPPGQAPGQEGTFPVTRLAYYLGTSPLDVNGFGQLKEVIDPNGVWTGFEYDQWGQQSKYSEGQIATQTAAASPVMEYMTQMGSDGNPHSNTRAGGGGGSETHDSNGNATSSTCIAVASAGGGSGASSFPFVLPCNAPSIPDRSAQFWSADYTPKGELIDLPLDLWLQGEGARVRTHRAAFDLLGRRKSASVESDEAGGSSFTRGLSYSYNTAQGTYTRTGPDAVETFVQLDAAGRTQFVRRGPSSSPLMTATYSYAPNGFLRTIVYGNGVEVRYSYDQHRLWRIEHVNALGIFTMRLEYTYLDNDLPSTIVESDNLGGSWVTRATTTFTYDRRSRLTGEQRLGTNLYILGYAYDAGGNRIKKIDYWMDQEVDYTYDISDPSAYGSNNNRLEMSRTFDTTQLPIYSGDPWKRLSTTYYEYNGDGNVTRVITEYPPSGGAQQNAATAAGGTAVSAVDMSAPSLEVGDPDAPGTLAAGDPDTMALMLRGGGGGGNGCSVGQTKYTAIRLGYAANGRTVTFAHDESWCWNPAVGGCPTNYAITWGREFRYDGARARYMNRKLNSDLSPATGGTVWSDYDGDAIYGDFTVSTAGAITNTDAYQAGLWRKVSGVASYLHNDILGTLRQTTGTTGAASGSGVFTAFGERQAGSSDRFGYVGAWGYQSTLDGGAEVFPYLHVGARYYDPSSGRFLQRDPIGIRGGPNVYDYVESRPTRRIDPKGHQAGGVPGTPAPPPPYVPPFGGVPDTPGSDYYPPESTGVLSTDLQNACTCFPGFPITVQIPPPPPPRCPPDCPELSNPDNRPLCGPGAGGGAAGGLLVLFALRYRRRSVNPRRSPDTNLTQMTVRAAHRGSQRRGDVLIRRRPIEKR